MWITTVVLMAVAVSLEPFRIGMTVLMLNRPRPMLQLLAFLAGGYTMGITVGVAVLFVFGTALSGSTHFTLPKVQIVVGAVAVVLAAALATGVASGRNLGAGAHGLMDGLMNGRTLWVAGAAGAGIALPSVDYLAVLAVIVASRTSTSTQLAVLVLFNVIAFTLVQIPLIAYLVAPTGTRRRMAALNDWIRSRSRRQVAALLAALGGVLVVAGAVGM
jgi:Sap, sulfolipid-1-addressing protein